MVAISERRTQLLTATGIAASFALLVAALLLAVEGFQANQRASELVTRSYAVKNIISDVGGALERSEAARSGYIIDPRPFRLEVYEQSSTNLMPLLRRLDELTADDAAQQRLLNQLRPLVRAELEDLEATMTLAKTGRFEDAMIMFARESDRGTLLRIREITDRFESNEDRLLEQSLGEARRSLGRVQFLLAMVAIALVASALGTLFVLRRFARKLGATGDRLALLNTDLEGEVERRTADLRRANEEIQRFAYIVSHDLRSPLVNILGFTAELDSTNATLGDWIARVRTEAPDLITQDVSEAQEDLPEAIGFIRSSTQKMDRLINAILKLSREGRRTLAPERLAMDEVIDEIAVSLDKTIEDAGACLIVEKPLPAITHDRVAIEQIFSNIIENAVKYRDDQRPCEVHVKGRSQSGRAIFEVFDNGRGIAPKDHERIFDLFRRSGTQDRTGEGIGLAQVRSLVNRLGGYIDVESEIGEGSVFRINIPETYVELGVQQ